MSTIPLSFLKFEPVIKDKVWGGDKLKDVLGKKAGDHSGESWEISGVRGNVSVVKEGIHKGKDLQSLLEEYTSQLVGHDVYQHYGNEFPLLFKFIDAADDLSVQLHPDDTLASERHDSFGKTEMWYIVDCDEDSRLILGFNEEMDAQTYSEVMKNGRITEVLREVPIKSGDSYFIATGTVHAIGKGTLLAEIQQTSDITYRIYDWDRPDQNGNMRELHTEEALEAIDYDASGLKLTYENEQNEIVNLCTSDYFITNRISIDGTVNRDLAQIDSFKVYMCVMGSVELSGPNEDLTLNKGETVLVPAIMDSLQLSSKQGVLLEVYIP